MAAGQSPLDQFRLEPIIELSLAGIDISVTKSSIFMMLTVAVVWLFFFFSMRGRALIPGRMQSFAEMMYEFVAGTLKDSVGNEGKPFFPFIFSLFMFVLVANLLGMVPFYNFTVTSHLIVTFALALFIFLGVTVLGIVMHGSKFFRLFLPDGTPWVLAPLLIPIEIISYLARPISLSIRLAANMMVGHIMLKILAGFIVAMIGAGLAGILGGAGLFVVLIGLSGFEIFVAVLQAYIFTILTCVYLNDAIHLH